MQFLNSPIPSSAQDISVPIVECLKKSCITELNQFNGKNTTLYPQWETKVCEKLKFDGHLISNNSEQAFYLFSYLKDDAAACAHSWFEVTNGTSELSVENFFKHLQSLFRNSSWKSTALTWINSEKQEKIPLIKWLPQFDQKLIKAGEYSWDENNKVITLHIILNRKFLNQLINNNSKNNTYTFFYQHIHKIDN